MCKNRLFLALTLTALLAGCGGETTPGEAGDMGAGRPENPAPDTNPPPPMLRHGPSDTLPASQAPTVDSTGAGH